MKNGVTYPPGGVTEAGPKYGTERAENRISNIVQASSQIGWKS